MKLIQAMGIVLLLAGNVCAQQPEVGSHMLSVRKADLQLMRGVEDQSNEALFILGDLSGKDYPDTIVRRIDQFFMEVQNGRKMPTNDWYDGYAPLGALWGEQICYQYGWDWYVVYLDGDEGGGRYAVMPPDHSLVVYPFVHLRESVEAHRPVAVHRIFRAIGKNPRLKDFGPGAYEDLSGNNTLLVFD